MLSSVFLKVLLCRPSNQQNIHELLQKYATVFDICCNRVKYFHDGGRNIDNVVDDEIDVNNTLDYFQLLQKQWRQIVTMWEKKIENKRMKSMFVNYFTINEIRNMVSSLNTIKKKTIEENEIKKNVIKENTILYKQIFPKFQFVNSLLTIEYLEQLISKWKYIEENDDDCIDKFIEIFENTLTFQNNYNSDNSQSIPIHNSKFLYLEEGKPNLIITMPHMLLLTTLQLIIQQQKMPMASQILICNEYTTIEEIDCLLCRCLQYADVSKSNKVLYMLTGCS